MVEHIIRTTAPYIKQRHYPLSFALQRQVNVEVDQMLRDDIIEASNYGSRIVLSSKADGQYRFCVNYNQLNEFSLPFAHLLSFTTRILEK